MEWVETGMKDTLSWPENSQANWTDLYFLLFWYLVTNGGWSLSSIARRWRFTFHRRSVAVVHGLLLGSDSPLWSFSSFHLVFWLDFQRLPTNEILRRWYPVPLNGLLLKMDRGRVVPYCFLTKMMLSFPTDLCSTFCWSSALSLVDFLPRKTIDDVDERVQWMEEKTGHSIQLRGNGLVLFVTSGQ